jgi:hypothetical protein
VSENLHSALTETFGHFNNSARKSQKPSAISMFPIEPLKTPRHFNFSTLNFYSVVERGSTINEVGRHRQC